MTSNCSSCGNGVADNVEVCDDGNRINGDGCDMNCLMIEAGYECPSFGAACTPLCSNG